MNNVHENKAHENKAHENNETISVRAASIIFALDCDSVAILSRISAPVYP